jgi:hypothetical protein
MDEELNKLIFNKINGIAFRNGILDTAGIIGMNM